METMPPGATVTVVSQSLQPASLIVTRWLPGRADHDFRLPAAPWVSPSMESTAGNPRVPSFTTPGTVGDGGFDSVCATAAAGADTTPSVEGARTRIRVWATNESTRASTIATPGRRPTARPVESTRTTD